HGMTAARDGWLTRFVGKAGALGARVRSNDMVRGASVLAAGTAAGQALILLAMPLVTRLYSPEDFGVLAVYASILALLVVVITLKFETAIVLAESDETAAQLLLLSLAVAAVVSALAGLGVLFAGST